MVQVVNPHFRVHQKSYAARSIRSSDQVGLGEASENSGDSLYMFMDTS